MTAGTGTKLLTTLLHELKRQQVQFANYSSCAVLKGLTKNHTSGCLLLDVKNRV